MGRRPKRTYEMIVGALRELRLQRDQADARFLLALVYVEQHEMEQIGAAGCTSFDQFLESNKLTSPTRYQGFKSGLDRVGEKAALAIGSDATIVAGKLTNGSDEYVGAVRAWSAENGNLQPTRRTANRILLQVDPRAEVPQEVRSQREVVALRAENARLRAENARLRAEVRSLEKELGRRKQRAA